MNNYAPYLPRDKYGEPMQDFAAPKLALARITSENATTSSVISLTHDTTMIEVAAIRGPVAIKWIGTGDTIASIVTVAGSTANYDHTIPQDTVRRFVVPIESNPQSGSVQGVNRALGLYQRLAYRSMNIASVLLSEF